MGRSYRVVCFDMDGTLLPMDIDEFLGAYYKDIAAYVAKSGRDQEAFQAALNAGVKAMAKNDGSRTNADAYWDAFGARMAEVGGDAATGAGAASGNAHASASNAAACGASTGADAGAVSCADVGAGVGSASALVDEWRTFLDAYYETDFAHIGDAVKPNPFAARAVNVLVEKGYPVVLATQPMFPERAVRWRLKWAGIDPSAFARMTHYENSLAIKPQLRYYAENLAACGVRGEDVLMVGNNTVDDLVFAGLGADVYLTTDYLLNPANVDMARVTHGTMEEFARWAEQLPPCENPAYGIAPGAVAAEAREAALVANVLPGVSDDAPLFAAEQDVVEDGFGKAGAGTEADSAGAQAATGNVRTSGAGAATGGKRVSPDGKAGA